MAICSFCSQDKKLTREHIYSDKVLRAFPKTDFTIDEDRKKAHKGDPVVKDLCADCNSKMSWLDNYMGTLAQDYFLRKSLSTLTIDYKRTLLWVLKTISNIERSKQIGSDWWKAWIPYFKGEKVLLNFKELEDISIFIASHPDKENLDAILGKRSIRSQEISLFKINGPNRTFSPDPFPDISKITPLNCQTSWAIQLGPIVLALFYWNSKPSLTRILIDEKILEFGWIKLEEKIVHVKFTRSPFNDLTYHLIGIVSHPDNRIIDFADGLEFQN